MTDKQLSTDKFINLCTEKYGLIFLSYNSAFSKNLQDVILKNCRLAHTRICRCTSDFCSPPSCGICMHSPHGQEVAVEADKSSTNSRRDCLSWQIP